MKFYTYKCSLDGNALCIVGKGFTNIQESPCVFIDLTKEQIKQINKLVGMWERKY